jgi:MFS family permease
MLRRTDEVSGLAVRESAWAPLRIGVFRAIYLAVLVSNVGTWMQTVGAQWLLVNKADAVILVPLVQVMDTAPDVLLSVVGGVLADTFDRRRLLIVVQGFLVIVGAVLTGLTVWCGCATRVLAHCFMDYLGENSGGTFAWSPRPNRAMADRNDAQQDPGRK